MSWLLGQTAALLTIMFFIGAALGCLLRRTFAAPEAEVTYGGTRTDAPAAVSVARPVEPLPEMARAAQPPRSRFEGALTGAPAPATTAQPVAPARPVVEAPRPAPPATPAPVANPTPVTPPVLQPRPAVAPGTTPVAEMPTPAAPAATAAAAPAPVAESLGVPVATSLGAAATVAVAAATAAASAASARITEAAAQVTAPIAVQPPASDVVPSVPAPAAPIAPVVVATGAAAAVAAALGQTVAPIQSAAAGDDLLRIQGIDPEIAGRLRAEGIMRFADIAAWTQPDVQRIGDVLGVRGRVERENWVEQAHILAGGGETYFSRRRANGEVATPAAATTSVLTNKVLGADNKPAVALTAAPVGKLGLEAASAAAAALAAAAGPVAEVAPVAAAAAPVVVAPAVAAPVVVDDVPASRPAVEDRAAFAHQPAASVVQTAPPAAVAAAAPLEPATPVRPAAQPMRDNLQRLSGVSSEVERMLNGQGVSRYAHLASWNNGDIERFDTLLGSDGRIARENWIEQAQILSRGGDTAYARDYDRRAIEALRGQPETKDAGAAARPSRLADAIRTNTTQGGTQTPSAPAATTTRQDFGGLRSVKSDAYRPSPVDAATAAAAAAAAASGSARVVRSSDVDDLKRIRGVGVLIERKLNSVGVTRYAQIGQWTNADIDKISQMLDFKGRIERENWVEQARILSSGGQTEFSRRVDRGEVETSRPKE
jgi:predicted flap endonuclease-1-like 5' DNA nuclease